MDWHAVMRSRLKRIRVILVLALVVIGLPVGGCLVLLAWPHHGKVTGKVWSESDAFQLSSIVSLKKRPGEDFKILQLADIQILHPFQMAQARRVITELVKKASPDLLVLTGDNEGGLLNAPMTQSLAHFIDHFNIPWAVVFGNHDAEGLSDKLYLSALYEKADNCLFEQGPPHIGGVGNYVVNIEEAGQIVFSIFLLDSGEYDRIRGGYAYIDERQIDWYEWCVRGMAQSVHGELNPAEGKRVPSICFFHIPLPEYQTAYERYEAGAIEGFGDNRETVCCPKFNSGFFHRAKELGSTEAFFVGHDHVNNSVLTYEGIVLAYGLKTGSASYSDEDRIGGTLVTIGDSLGIEHIYVRSGSPEPTP